MDQKNTIQKIALGIALALLPMQMSTGLPIGIARFLGGEAYASTAIDEVRVYTFTEVGQIAQSYSPDIIRQKASIDQAVYNTESQLSNYQMQIYEYYSKNERDITEETLLSLQDSYEDAYNRYLDAEEVLENLKPKVAYQAQKLYLDILLQQSQITIQEQEIKRLQAEYELAEVKAVFGVLTQNQLKNAKSQWDEGIDQLESLNNTLKNSRNTMREYLNIRDTVEFELEDPPVFGQYLQVFDDQKVLEDAMKNSLALKQAKREVEDLSARMLRYEVFGEYDKLDQLAASGRSTDLAYNETKLSLQRTVESTLKDFQALKVAEEKALDSLEEAKKNLAASQMKLEMGLATLSEVRQGEKTVVTAERSLVQSRYNYYLGAKRVILLTSGILVN